MVSVDPADAEQFAEEGWFPAVALERLPKDAEFRDWRFADLSVLDGDDGASRKTLDAFLELLGARLVNRDTGQAYLRRGCSFWPSVAVVVRS